MFSQTVEYAMRAVVCLATEEQRVMGATEIAKMTDVPQSYLIKVLQQLTRDGIIKSKRGKGGGFSLALPSNEISLLQIVSAVDPIKRIKTCPLNLPSHCQSLCPLHSKLDSSFATLEKSLGEAFVSEMIDKPRKTAREKQSNA